MSHDFKISKILAQLQRMASVHRNVAIFESPSCPWVSKYVWLTGDFLRVKEWSLLPNGNNVYLAVVNYRFTKLSISFEFQMRYGKLNFVNGGRSKTTSGELGVRCYYIDTPIIEKRSINAMADSSVRDRTEIMDIQLHTTNLETGREDKEKGSILVEIE